MLHLQVAPFDSIDPNITHTTTDWLIADSMDFSNIIEESLDNAVDLTDYRSNLSIETAALYFKTRFQLDNDGTPEYTGYSNIVVVGATTPDPLENHLSLVRTDTALMTSTVLLLIKIMNHSNAIIDLENRIIELENA